jgi:xanthine dehydrogenase accessory factor
LQPEFSDNVLPFWLEKAKAGHEMCLATLVNIDGSAPRPLGSQIAIAGDGTALGFITGGCAEAAIIAEALQAIKAGENRLVRYGEGSPYKDIALPCGSGIDVYFDVTLNPETVEQISAQLAGREPTHLRIDLGGKESRVVEGKKALPIADNGYFTKPYTPQFKLFIVGKGPVVPALAALADQASFDVEIASPETETLARIADTTGRKIHLKSPTEYAPGSLDRWCVGVTLFHDHEWEPTILEHFLNSQCFYVGALGSRTTHATRLETLKATGIGADKLARLRGPVGLDIQASTPTEIAISILAEIIQTFRTAERGPARWQR